MDQKTEDLAVLSCAIDLTESTLQPFTQHLEHLLQEEATNLEVKSLIFSKQIKLNFIYGPIDFSQPKDLLSSLFFAFKTVY